MLIIIFSTFLLFSQCSQLLFFFFFFFNDPATTEIYTLSLHDALPIWDWPSTEGVGCLSAAGSPKNRHVCRQRQPDRKSTRLNSSHSSISYAVFCLKKKKKKKKNTSNCQYKQMS